MGAPGAGANYPTQIRKEADVADNSEEQKDRESIERAIQKSQEAVKKAIEAQQREEK